MNEILYGAEEQQQQPLRAPRRSSYNNYRQHNAEAQLDQLLGPDSAADVDDIVRCFTAADALEVFEEFAYGVPALQDTTTTSPTARATSDEHSPKGVNATLDPAIFDKFPRSSSLISLSPSPDQIHSGKSSTASSSPTSSVETSPNRYHLPSLPIVTDVDSNHSSFASSSAAAAFAFAPPWGPPPFHQPYQIDQDIMDSLSSAAAAVEQHAAYPGAPPTSGGGGATKPKGSSKKKRSAAPAAAADGARFKPFHEEKWDQKLQELIDFRAANGHTLVPHTYDPNPQLARWVKRQRRQYKLMQAGKTSTMTPARVQILEQVGFVWDSHEVGWREKVQELDQYRSQHGDCLVPSSYRDNPQLATWVKCQRRQYKLYWEGKPAGMNPERIAELDRVGFCWEIRPNGEHAYGTPTDKPAAAAASSRKRSADSNPAKRGKKVAKRDSLDLLGDAAASVM